MEKAGGSLLSSRRGQKNNAEREQILLPAPHQNLDKKDASVWQKPKKREQQLSDWKEIENEDGPDYLPCGR
jgi:uncharacterized caspase-like protein